MRIRVSAPTRYTATWITLTGSPWRRNPAEYRKFAEDYFAGVKPLLIKAGLAKG